MAVPTSYTEESFALYIHDEVLGHVAESMEWGIKTTPTYGTLTTYDDTAINDSIVEFTTNPDNLLGVGTRMTFAGHAQVYTVAEVGFGDAGHTRIKARIFPYAQAAFLTGTVATYEKSPITQEDIDNYYKETNPVYGYILNETLFLLDYTDIAQVTGQKNLTELRVAARVEAWHSVMANSASFTNDDDTEGNSFNRKQVWLAAKDQLQLAQNEYDRLFNASAASTAGLATSGTAQVRAIW